MDYSFASIMLLMSYAVFRAVSWIISSTIKLAFLAAFITLGILAMSSSVGLLR